MTHRSRVVVWLIPALAVTGLLFVGFVGFVSLLVTLNGVNEARAMPLFIVYLVLLLADLIFVVWASRWIWQKTRARTDWPRWVQASVAAISALLAASVALLIGSLIILVVGLA